MRFTPAALARLRTQFGVINRRQLRSLGCTGPQIDAMVRRGHLEVVGHGVYRRTGSPRGEAQRAMIAILRTRLPARITGTLLLALIGCEGYEVEEATFTVLLPRPRRLTNVDFPWRLDPAPRAHAATITGLPSVTPARNVLELAADLHDDEALLLAADRLRWRTGTGAAALARVADEVPDHPGVARLDRLGLLDEHRPESPGERALSEILGPLPFDIEWQVWVAPDLRVDALIRDVGLVLEYDGPTHAGSRDRAADAARDRRLEALGYTVVHLSAEDRRDPAALRRRLITLWANLAADVAT